MDGDFNYHTGETTWLVDGKLHRDGGPAAKEWYQEGQLHRDGGPALVYTNGTKQWYSHGKLHRLNGPAVIDKDGVELWYLYGICVSSWTDKEDLLKQHAEKII